MGQDRGTSASDEEVWTIPFKGLVAFLGLYYLSPEDFLPFLGSIPTAKIVAGLTLLTVISRNLSAGRPWLKFSDEAKRFLAFAAIIVIGIPFSVWPGGSVEVLQQRIMPITIFFVFMSNTIQSRKQLQVLVSLIVGCAVLISVVSCYHYAIGEVDKFGRLVGYGSKEYENPNDLSLGLLTLIPLSAALFSGEHRIARKLFFAGAVGMMCAAILASLSRTGMVGLAFLGGLTLMNLVKRDLAKAVLVSFLLLIICLTVLGASQTLADRFESIFNDDKDDTGSKAERLSHMYDALIVMFEHPLMGVGLGQSMVAIVAMHDGAANQWVKIHDVYLLIGAELGIPGLCIYVWMIVAVFRELKQNNSAETRGALVENRVAEHLGIGLRHAILVFVIASAFSPVAYNWFVYILIGLASALMNTGMQSVRSTKLTKEFVRHSLRPAQA